MTEELPDKSAVRSTTVSIGRAQLAARVDISYKSVTGDSDEMVWMSHAHSRRIHDDHLDGTFYMSNHLGLSRLKSGDRSCGQLYNQGRHCLLDRAHNGSVICCVTHVCVTSPHTYLLLTLRPNPQTFLKLVSSCALHFCTQGIFHHTQSSS